MRRDRRDRRGATRSSRRQRDRTGRARRCTARVERWPSAPSRCAGSPDDGAVPGRAMLARPDVAAPRRSPPAAGSTCALHAHLLRHPAHRAQAPGQLHRRDHAVRRRPGPRRGDLLRRRPARASPSPTSPAALRESVYDTAATLLAAGLDPERCIFFRQSDVPEHTELCWLLSSVTAYGDLNRMHQFKEKSGAQRELVSAGLFFYPVLMAADVLAYRAHEVPVGEDQRQHVELMRDIAERFNARFGETLVVPEGRDPDGRRADHGPPVPRPQDVDHRRQPAGHGVRARRARGDRQEGPLGGDRLRLRGASRRATSRASPT